MFSKSTILFAALQATLAAAGNAIISNRCNYDIWVWSVQPGSSSAAIHIPARSQWSEPMHVGSPTSLKVSKSDTLLAGQQTQFEYSIINNQLWFDLSFVNCAQGKSSANCPGADGGLSMSSPNSACGKLDCSAGSYCPTQAYFVDQPMLKLGIQEPVFTCPSAGDSMDLYMRTCSGAEPLKRSIAGRMLVDMDA
ncbi:hypothetical protein ACEQ8H_007110 [Pleosporales sp. CAS-2024a]